MSRTLCILSALFATVLIPVQAFADGGTDNDSSPYSKFGIGMLSRKGSAFQHSMGGVGTATRDNRHINTLNPAAVTARDSLAFMGDFGVAQKNTYASQGSSKSVYNTFNINNFVMSFPIWRSSAFMVGIAPFSSVGYDIVQRVKEPGLIGVTGNITDTYTGDGSIYNLYVGAGVTFWKRLSLGAQLDYYFGNLTKDYYRTFESSSYRTLYSGSNMYIRGIGGKLGIQYEETIAKQNKITLGATYRFKTNLYAENEFVNHAVQSELIDTLACLTSDKAFDIADGTNTSKKKYSQSVDFAGNKVNIPWEASVGISYKWRDVFRVEADYTISDWTGSNMDKVIGLRTGSFAPSVLHSGNLGFEYTPNRSDIRYFFKRCTYRVGAYYTQENYMVSGYPISTAGVTLGMSVPVFRWLNNISFAIDFGQRGALFTPSGSGLITERFVNFSVSMNIFDIWFVKPRYE